MTHNHFVPLFPSRGLHFLAFGPELSEGKNKRLQLIGRIGAIALLAATILPVVGTTIASSRGVFLNFSGLSNQAGNALIAGIPLFLHTALLLIGCVVFARNTIVHQDKCTLKQYNTYEFFAVPALLAFSASYAILATTTSLGLHDLSFGGVISNEASILVFASAAAAMLGAWGVACWAQRSIDGTEVKLQYDRKHSRFAPVLGFVIGGAIAAGVMCGLQYSDVLDLASAAMPAEAAIALISLGSAIAVSIMACAINYKVNALQPKFNASH